MAQAYLYGQNSGASATKVYELSASVGSETTTQNVTIYDNGVWNYEHTISKLGSSYDSSYNINEEANYIRIVNTGSKYSSLGTYIYLDMLDKASANENTTFILGMSISDSALSKIKATEYSSSFDISCTNNWFASVSQSVFVGDYNEYVFEPTTINASVFSRIRISVNSYSGFSSTSDYVDIKKIAIGNLQFTNNVLSLTGQVSIKQGTQIAFKLDNDVEFDVFKINGIEYPCYTNSFSKGLVRLMYDGAQWVQGGYNVIAMSSEVVDTTLNLEGDIKNLSIGDIITFTTESVTFDKFTINGVEYQVDIDTFNGDVMLQWNGVSFEVTSGGSTEVIINGKPYKEKKINLVKHSFDGAISTSVPKPTNTRDLGSEIVDNIIYCIGGANGNLNEAFNIEQGTWETKTPPPTEGTNTLTNFGIGAVDGLIYCIGGMGGAGSFDTNYVYNPITDTWNIKTSMPTPRHSLTSSVVDGLIYCIGGYAPGSIKLANEAYNPITDTWETKSEYVYNCYKYPSTVIDGVIYCVGGINASSSIVSWHCAYEPLTNVWKVKGSVPWGIPLKDFGLNAIDGIMYIIGGTTSGNVYQDGIIMLDPVTNTTSSSSQRMSIARSSLTSNSFGKTIYIIGGRAGNTMLKTNEILITSGIYYSEIKGE